jgi:hypothetical protein
MSPYDLGLGSMDGLGDADQFFSLTTFRILRSMSRSPFERVLDLDLVGIMGGESGESMLEYCE